MRAYRRILAQLIIPAAVALVPLSLVAQNGAPPTAAADAVLKAATYQTPPKELADAVLAPRYLNVSLANISPDKKSFVEEIGDGPVVMKTFSKPFHDLGGLFVDYKANRSRTLTIRNNVAIEIVSATDGTKKDIQLPPGARVTNATWSPDSKSIGFYVHGDDATQIWIADVATGQAHQVTRTPVLATLVTTFQFTNGGREIAFVQIPDNRPAMPQEPAIPPGPSVKMDTDPHPHRLRTFPSLMSTPYEFDLLEWHATGQLAVIDVQTRTVKKIGAPAMITAFDVSPDAKYVRVARMVKPFSYDVPVSNFGGVEEVWDASGRKVADLSARPLNLGVQDPAQPNPDDQPGAGGGRGANQTGKREVMWRTDGAGLTYLEQEPAPARGRAPSAPDAAPGEPQARGGGRAGGAAQRPDRLYEWLPPFEAGTQKVLFENPTRMTGHRFSPDGHILFFGERAGQNTIESAVYLNEDPKKAYTLARFRTDDASANPGTLVSTRGVVAAGRGAGAGGAGRGGAVNSTPVLVSPDGTSVYFEGTRYDKNPEQVGPRTFVDRVAIRTGGKERLYESDNNGMYERLSVVIDPEAKRFVTQRETPTDVPQNFYVDAAARVQLTHNTDVHPDLTHAVVERFEVTRPDGFMFHVKVVLPQNYQKGTRLPALFWFYPREYTTQDEYDRPDQTFNKNAFTNFNTRSMEYFTRLGYAVVDPDTPIVGPQGQMNNNYVSDLRNDLSATIDELDRRGLIDRQRLAIGGHSYGAFSTVNAMVHTPFFKAGIAGDGDYNRTLTPMGFQNERRDLWEARDVYLGMSPFMYANDLTGALLMYHDLGDQNVGTDPINSIRLYHALSGLGKTTALYLYPLEDHGPVARETLLDLWARWGAWLDKYVKNPQPASKKPIMETVGSRQ